MALCGGRPALGGPLPTLIARAGPPPFGGPDMAGVFLLFYMVSLYRCYRKTRKGWGASRIQFEYGSAQMVLQE